MTDAVESMSDVISKHSYQVPYGMELVQAILAAIQADPLAYVKPKPLEWVEYGINMPNTWHTLKNSVVNTYIITTGTFNTVPWFQVEGMTNRDNKYDTIEAAKDAAYNDFCKRVKGLF